MAARIRFHGEMYRGENKQWFWRVKSSNGKTVADGAESYVRMSACQAMFATLHPGMELRVL